MEKIIWYEGEKFRVRNYLDIDTRELSIDLETGQGFEIMRGDIPGIEIYSSSGELIGSFDYVNFYNDNVIRKIIEENY